jgi:O-antigen/teichoic acid export membrane protein
LSKVLRLFSAAIIDQVVLSAASFAVGFVLIRYTSDFDYGVYVLIQSAILLLCSTQGSWIASPLAVMASRKPPDDRRATIGAVTDGQRRILLRLAAVMLPLPTIAFLMGRIGGSMASVLTVAVIAGWGAMRRDYLRNVLLIYSKPQKLLRADAIYAGVLLIGVLWASFGAGNAILWATIGLAAAAWAGATGAYRALGADPGWVVGDRSAAWNELRSFGPWSLVGSVIYWLFGQSYSYVLATRLDLTAVTDVNASRLLLMPAFVVSIGIQGVLAPMAANWNAEVGHDRLLRRLSVILLAIAAADLVYFAVVWVLRDWLTIGILHKHITNRDHLLLLWAAVALVGLMRDILQCGLSALGRFRSMATQVAVSAVVALTLMWLGTAWWGAAAVLIGQLAGELVNVAGIVIALRSSGRELVHA